MIRIFIPVLGTVMLLSSLFCQAQSFHAPGGNIPNNSTGNCFTQTVSGIGNLSPANGLVRVCLSIDSPRPNDLDITLESPDGTVVTLSTDNGGSSGNDYYEGLCFSDCGPSGPITLGSNFRGVYTPEGSLASFNTGSGGDGIWKLCIDDDNSLGGNNTLHYWNMTFGSVTPPASPSGEDCANAYPLTNLPFEHTCTTLAGSVDNYSACTGMMEGADYLYSFTPTVGGEYLSLDVSQDFSAPSGFPTVSLLDTCPSVALAQNCLQSEIQMFSYENILHITSQLLTPGKTYYIVIASTSGTGGVYDISIRKGLNGSENCLNATVIDNEEEYAGNNYGATAPNLQAPSTMEMSCNGSIDNFIFYTFTTDATGSTVYVNVTDIDCDLSCGGSCGIQLALFEEPAGGACLGPGSWGSPVYCESSTETNVYYAWNGLSPNTRYYLMVDGNAGSQCVWNLRAMGDFSKVLLPVTFSDLSGSAREPGNFIEWTTEAESGLQEFQVQAARDPSSWETIAHLPPKGREDRNTQYQFLHPVSSPGKYFYRIRSVDRDGQSRNSRILTVQRDFATDTYDIYPNPVLDFLRIQSDRGEILNVKITSLTGKHFPVEMDRSNASSLTLHTTGLPEGMYFLSFSNGSGELVTWKLIKK